MISVIRQEQKASDNTLPEPNPLQTDSALTACQGLEKLVNSIPMKHSMVPNQGPCTPGKCSKCSRFPEFIYINCTHTKESNPVQSRESNRLSVQNSISVSSGSIPHSSSPTSSIIVQNITSGSIPLATSYPIPSETPAKNQFMCPSTMPNRRKNSRPRKYVPANITEYFPKDFSDLPHPIPPFCKYDSPWCTCAGCMHKYVYEK